MGNFFSGDSIGIVGGGNSAHALACHLSSQGHAVHMYFRNATVSQKLKATKQIRCSGFLEGNFKISEVHHCFKAFCDSVDTIFVATTADVYATVASALAPHLKTHHTVVLFSSKLLGSVLFESFLKKHDAARCVVLETDALFACRLQPDGSVVIRNRKRWNLVAAATHETAKANVQKVTKYFDGLELAHHVIQRGLSDFGAMAHPTIMLANLNKIDRGEEFLFYVDGLTPRTSALLNAVHTEFQNIAFAYGSKIVEIPTLLNSYYGAELSSPYNAMRSVSNYKTSLAPKSLDHRYLNEDIACTLVPACLLAQKAGVQTPTLNAIVHLASCVLETRFETIGRTLELVGWHALSAQDIRDSISAQSTPLRSQINPLFAAV